MSSLGLRCPNQHSGLKSKLRCTKNDDYHLQHLDHHVNHITSSNSIMYYITKWTLQIRATPWKQHVHLQGQSPLSGTTTSFTKKKLPRSKECLVKDQSQAARPVRAILLQMETALLGSRPLNLDTSAQAERFQATRVRQSATTATYRAPFSFELRSRDAGGSG